MADDDLSPADAMAGRGRLGALAQGAKLLGVLRAASSAGVVAALTAPRSLDDLDGAAPGLDRATLHRVVIVLTDAGLVARDGERYVLADDVRALATDVVGIDLDAVVTGLLLEVQRAGSVFAAPAYPSGADALTLAAVSGGRPVPTMVGLLTAVYDELPAFRDQLESGGPFLDAGAGIGGNLLAAATAFPALQAVGVEADETVAATLQARVDAAGLGERVTVRQGDVRQLDLEPSSFAAAYWAQTFFPPDTRAASLDAVVRALQPGGVLVVQELFPAPSDGDVSAQLDRLVMTSWGIAYGESAEQVSEELRAAGLTTDEPVTTSLGRLVVAHKPER